MIPHQTYKPRYLQDEIKRLMDIGAVIIENGKLQDKNKNVYVIDYDEGTITIN